MRLSRLSDEAICELIGQSIRAHRLRKNITQAQLAQELGVSKPTIVNLEAGQAKLSTLISALRSLKQLDLLAALLDPPRQSPLDLVERVGNVRQRASGNQNLKITFKKSYKS